MKYLYHCFYGVVFLCCFQLKAQGPPITADKPIMLGSKSIILKTLTRIQNTQNGVLVKAPLMVHYLPTANSLIAVHIPYLFRNQEQEQGLGNLELMLKYQFYRNDGIGKTVRAVFKNFSKFGTSQLDIENLFLDTNTYQNYNSVVLGYESIRLGLSNELGYNYVSNHDLNELRLKSGVGLPLLKPSYPVKQINLYFETQFSWYHQIKDRAWFYSQGFQYAIHKWTFELAYQLPVLKHSYHLDYSTFIFGARFII